MPCASPQIAPATATAAPVVFKGSLPAAEALTERVPFSCLLCQQMAPAAESPGVEVTPRPRMGVASGPSAGRTVVTASGEERLGKATDQIGIEAHESAALEKTGSRDIPHIARGKDRKADAGPFSNPGSATLLAIEVDEPKRDPVPPEPPGAVTEEASAAPRARTAAAESPSIGSCPGNPLANSSRLPIESTREPAADRPPVGVQATAAIQTVNPAATSGPSGSPAGPSLSRVREPSAADHRAEGTFQQPSRKISGREETHAEGKVPAASSSGAVTAPPGLSPAAPPSTAPVTVASASDSSHPAGHEDSRMDSDPSQAAAPLLPSHSAPPFPAKQHPLAPSEPAPAADPGGEFQDAARKTIASVPDQALHHPPQPIRPVHSASLDSARAAGVPVAAGHRTVSEGMTLTTPSAAPSDAARAVRPLSPSHPLPTLATAFHRLDGAAAPRLLETTPQRLAVGVRDAGLGWVEVRTHAVGGQVAATLATASPEAHAAIAAELPALREALLSQQVQLHSLSSESFAGSSGQRQEEGQTSSGPGNAENHPPAQPKAGSVRLPSESEGEVMSYISIRV